LGSGGVGEDEGAKAAGSLQGRCSEVQLGVTGGRGGQSQGEDAMEGAVAAAGVVVERSQSLE